MADVFELSFWIKVGLPCPPRHDTVRHGQEKLGKRVRIKALVGLTLLDQVAEKNAYPAPDIAFDIPANRRNLRIARRFSP